jgi:RNA 3'-terminal phosphate cyclase
MALSGGGSFRATAPSGHTLSQREVLRLFLPVAVEIAEEESGAWRYEVVSS